MQAAIREANGAGAAEIIEAALGIEGVDVDAFEDGLGGAVAGNLEHGASELFGSGDELREAAGHPGKKRREDLVEDAIDRGSRLDAVQGDDEGGAEGIGRFEGKFAKVVFGFAFDAGPHDAALFRAIGAGIPKRR